MPSHIPQNGTITQSNPCSTVRRNCRYVSGLFQSLLYTALSASCCSLVKIMNLTPCPFPPAKGPSVQRHGLNNPQANPSRCPRDSKRTISRSHISNGDDGLTFWVKFKKPLNPFGKMLRIFSRYITTTSTRPFAKF